MTSPWSNVAFIKIHEENRKECGTVWAMACTRSSIGLHSKLLLSMSWGEDIISIVIERKRRNNNNNKPLISSFSLSFMYKSYSHSSHSPTPFAPKQQQFGLHSIAFHFTVKTMNNSFKEVMLLSIGSYSFALALFTFNQLCIICAPDILLSTINEIIGLRRWLLLFVVVVVVCSQRLASKAHSQRNN